MGEEKKAASQEVEETTQNEETQDESQEQEQEQEQKQEQEQDELSKCQEELEEQKDKYLRAHAEFENYKKRFEREKADAIAFANESFARDLLTVLDTFENALKSINNLEESSEAVEKIKEGMSLTYEQLLSILKKHGVEEVECDGEFNPEVHQAVTQMESDEHNSGDIVQVLQKGYKLKDRLLRASMVATCK